MFKIRNLGHDLPVSVNFRVILPFRKDIIFPKIKARESFRIYSTTFKNIYQWYNHLYTYWDIYNREFCVIDALNSG